MKQAVYDLLTQSLQSLAVQNGLAPDSLPSIELVVSKDTTQGDFACNIAFKLSKLLKMPPAKAAQELIPIIQKANHPVVERLEVGGSGFLNIYLRRASLNQVLHEVRQAGASYGKTDFGKGKKALVEFVSANPTGPLTIAHGRQAALGDSLVRILRAAGFQADAEYYLNDAGRQMNLLGQSLYARYCQALGHDKPLPEDGYQGSYLITLAQNLTQEKRDTLLADEASGVAACKRYAQENIMAGILDDLQSVDVQFNKIFSETSLYENKSVEAAFQDLTTRGYLFEKDGALWFRSTDFGDDKDRVVRKSTGELTYIAPDIAYHRMKFERGYEWLIDLMGPDHHGYITRLKAACQALGHNANQIEIRIVQLTTLYRKGEPVRMSTRAGEFVTLRELVQEVGADAARFFFLMRKVESHLDFDLELAKEKSQENPVFYMQYAHARIASILRNAEGALDPRADVQKLTTPEEISLIKKIYEWPQTITNAAIGLEPYRIVEYLHELAALFHKFYSEHRVLCDDPVLTQARLILADAVRIVIANGLYLLGVSAPERM